MRARRCGRRAGCGPSRRSTRSPKAPRAPFPGRAAVPARIGLLRLADYAAARTHLARAEPLIRGSTDPAAARILPVLLFQLGASRFFVGEDGPAIETLTAFVALGTDSRSLPTPTSSCCGR